MKFSFLIPIVLILGGLMSFALARIAIRLQQAPSLAALASALIMWQLVALMEGQAALASSVLLLIGAGGLLVLTQWLTRLAALEGKARWILLVLVGMAWVGAITFPPLRLELALIFLSAFAASAGGALMSLRLSRRPVSLGNIGLSAFGLIGLWLLARSAASVIAGLD